MIESLQNNSVQRLRSLSAKDMPVDILRLDRLHPVVSGNKWFKLKYYLQDALAQQKTTIASFGGAYSNHIVAIAFAAKEAGLKSIGFIREKFPLTALPLCNKPWITGWRSLCGQGGIPPQSIYPAAISRPRLLLGDGRRLW
jgi:1-aminocyclopropane-1-carboxylate deaminase/D-cysteine desulfhydrase-like pyridoxal-dependent ACC family enzyme